MHPHEKEIFNLVLAICLILAIILSYFFYSILKYHRRDLKDKLEMIYGKDGILEEEKKRMGREIHDGVSSGLAGIKLMVESLEVSDNDREKLTGISQSLNTTLTNLRSVLNGLMEINLRNKTLPEVLTDYFDKHNMNAMTNNMKIDYLLEAELDYPIEKSNHIYRIFQEVIANTSKHADATLLKIHAKETDDYTEISFKDNGTGFNLDHVQANKTGIGLNNIKYRTGIINGTYHINTEINKGTEIILKIPA